jgi:hypothetical protein
MVRIKASILILALMVAPLASLCGAPSGTPKPCPPLCPMLHGGTHANAEQTDEMECHHGKSSKEDCVMKSGCGHTLDLGLTSPLPPAISCHVMELTAPGPTGTIYLAGGVPSLAGFQTPPLQPPRT